MYKVDGVFKFIEEDNFESGALPNTEQFMYLDDIYFKADTKEELLIKVMDFHKVDYDSLTLNSCDEKGRLDVTILENADGYKAYEHEIELWREGKINLYYAIYTYRVYKCENVEL